MQFLNKPQAVKVAVATLLGAIVLSFWFRTRQRLTEQIDTVPLNQAISELTDEIQTIKPEIEQLKKVQERPEGKTQTEKEIEGLRFTKRLFSLRYHKPSEVQQIFLGLIGFILVFAGLVATAIQINGNTNALDSTIDLNIMSHALDVDRLFIDSPDLRPYFFDGTPIPSTNPNYNKARAVADYQLDFFATFFDQSGYWQVLKNDPVAQQAWGNYMDASFRQSPIMCHELKEASTEHNYEDGFIKRFKGDCPEEFG